ncbi:MAG: DNA/RNA non-specific endonuclease [Erysipelotrichaceae bacterium]|nr:DNA/RNA non-specific endonuclease [Erysipelotrichaceae bacterium]
MNNIKKKLISILLLILLGAGYLFINEVLDPILNTNPPVNVYLGNDPSLQEHPKAPERDWLNKFAMPEYAGEAYVVINNNEPFFDTKTLKADPYEIYYDLDELGRCTLADAVAGLETMPTEKREKMSEVKPTGWHNNKYDQSLVDGQLLYNRCHLIAFGLCGESANPYNLVTGTRYFNTVGINDFENMVMDYIKETGNHVRYRVTPVFSGNNLVCDGQLTEAYSIEDNGEGICFCIWSFNVQPGIVIDYKTGDNWLDESYSKDYDYVINISKKKVHAKDCEGVSKMSEGNKQYYSGNLEDLLSKGYVLDNACLN